MAFLAKCADRLWCPWLFVLFLGVGGLYTWKLRFPQPQLPFRLRRAAGRRPSGRQDGGELTQTQALATALASTVGTGSVAGVAAAIFYGGPGAVFWMWASAFLGMATAFGEKTLASESGVGPMGYMTRYLGRPGKALAGWFSFCCVLSSLTGGALVQTNSIAASLHTALGWAPLPVGVVTALLVGVVTLGGLGRVGRFSEKAVPMMGALFLGSGLWVIFVHRSSLPAAFSAIFHGAFRPRAAFGGYSASLAARYGVARGVFTNEAGLGSSAMAHAAAKTDHPARAGLWGMAEVFLATGLVCSVTALAILTSGVYDPHTALRLLERGRVPAELVGAPLSAAAWGTVFGRWGPVIVAVCLLLFAFTSLLGWNCYGERALAWLTGSPALTPPFRAVFLLTAAAGSVGSPEGLWALADLTNGLMALPNLTALALLAPRVPPLLEDFMKTLHFPVKRCKMK